MATKKKSLSRKKSLSKVTKKTSPKAIYFRSEDDFLSHLSKNHLFLTEDPSKLYPEKRSSTRRTDLSDSDLINVIHTQKNYKELFSRYQKKLFIYLFHLVGNRDEAEDILQNVFSKMYKNIDAFDTSRKFSSWIYRIAHNEAINFLKRKGKRYSVSWDDITTSKDKLDTASNDEIPEERWEHLEIVREIDKALKKLPQKYQQVLKLRYFQEYSYEDIGKMLGKPVNTIGTLINRAKKKLLEVVKGQRDTK